MKRQREASVLPCHPRQLEREHGLADLDEHQQAHCPERTRDAPMSLGIAVSVASVLGRLIGVLWVFSQHDRDDLPSNPVHKVVREGDVAVRAGRAKLSLALQRVEDAAVRQCIAYRLLLRKHFARSSLVVAELLR